MGGEAKDSAPAEARRPVAFRIKTLIIVAFLGIFILVGGFVMKKFFQAICTAPEGSAMGTILSLNTVLSVYYGKNDAYPIHPVAVDVNPSPGKSISGDTQYDFGRYFERPYSVFNPSNPWALKDDYRYRGDARDYTLSIKAAGGDGCDRIAGTWDDCILFNKSKGKIERLPADRCL